MKVCLFWLTVVIAVSGWGFFLLSFFTPQPVADCNCAVVSDTFLPHVRVPGESGPINIGNRLELMIDDLLIDKLTDAQLMQHSPVAREVALVHDQPWEGNASTYHTVFKDGDIYRMYYRGSNWNAATRKSTGEHTCYAESTDGIHWVKPRLGIIEYNGSKDNNIVWAGSTWRKHGSHAVMPFKDANPKAAADAKYKALAIGYTPPGTAEGWTHALYALKSPDGLRWSLMQETPIYTKGAFDSANVGFWDPTIQKYRLYFREYRRNNEDFGHLWDLDKSVNRQGGTRDIMTSTSDDFLHWAPARWLNYGDAAFEHLYTNAVTPYPRAPHILMGFPMRLLAGQRRNQTGPIGVSDSVFMTSRDGETFARWPNAFLRPGPQSSRWVPRSNMIAWGIVPTKSHLPDAPDELSIYSVENYLGDTSCRIRRFSIRTDGFVSVHASLKGGEVITRPLIFSRPMADATAPQNKVRLVLNYATSALGSIKCELLDESGVPLPGYSMKEFAPLCGDGISHVVQWKGRSDLSDLAGKPIRLRVVLKDADVYSFQFAVSRVK